MCDRRLSKSRRKETCVRRAKCSPPARGAYIGWRYLARNRGAPRFVMTSLSCRRVDNAPRHCRFLRTFDFADDCRVNFSGVCCIVAREYGGRRFAAVREGCLGYSSLSSFSPSFAPLPRAVPRWGACNLAGPSDLP